MRILAPLSIAAFLSACSPGLVDPPSLAPRPGEALDPRLPVDEGNTAPAPIAAALKAQLDANLAQARDGERVFDIMAAGSVPQIEAAGAPGSESWTQATELLSRLDATRAPVSVALADTDALATRAIAEEGWVNPSERELIDRVASDIAVIDARVAAIVDRLDRKLRP